MAKVFLAFREDSWVQCLGFIFRKNGRNFHSGLKILYSSLTRCFSLNEYLSVYLNGYKLSNSAALFTSFKVIGMGLPYYSIPYGTKTFFYRTLLQKCQFTIWTPIFQHLNCMANRVKVCKTFCSSTFWISPSLSFDRDELRKPWRRREKPSSYSIRFICFQNTCGLHGTLLLGLPTLGYPQKSSKDSRCM